MPRNIPIGAKVVKTFGGVSYIGRVTDSDRERDTNRKIWRVEYTDGDVEDLYSQELRPHLGEASRIPRDNKAYLKRKSKENSQFIRDCKEWLTCLSGQKGSKFPGQLNVLALDDIVVEDNGCVCPNTTRSWAAWSGIYGGGAKRVWVPNPSVDVVSSVLDWGAHGYLCTLGELLRHRPEKMPKMDALYLDLCGFYRTIRPDMAYLFNHHHRFLQDKVVLHLTTARREGLAPEFVANDLERLCQKSGYGTLTVLRMYNSKTMLKFAFLLSRKTYPIRSRVRPRTLLRRISQQQD